jgi:ubiquinone/menaquinone biosynthesis C-methylase UbiE
VCNASFHHYPHPQEVLKEMHRVMKKDAILFIGEGYIIEPFRFLLNVSFRFSKSGDVRTYGKKELSDLLQKNGFNLLEIKKTGMQSVLFIAKAI